MYIKRTVKHRKIRDKNLKNYHYATGANVEFLIKQDWRFNLKVSEKNFSKLRLTNFKKICFITGKARGILFKGFARHSIKYLALRGLILGIKKASW